MSYVDDVSLSLAHVLDQAAFHKDARLAGYAANLDFWVEEIRHCLDVLAGYQQRFNRLVDARREFALERNVELDQAWITRTTTDDELQKLEQRVKSSAQNFLKVCCATSWIDHVKQCEIEAYLGIRINYSRKLTS
ncbi:hypothetical protein Pan258_16820 [Symmachiella dynata]|uniref:hypothetical protein n=1 Tax=Symmachiella dynata TaxID=2527995 RepID=UPI00118B221F|nr:hypothetical protein [Symmachiella dynata]QDT47646.1 hypothetical protein Pan258_16820 [Symmachiella dynata]